MVSPITTAINAARQARPPISAGLPPQAQGLQRFTPYNGNIANLANRNNPMLRSMQGVGANNVLPSGVGGPIGTNINFKQPYHPNPHGVERFDPRRPGFSTTGTKAGGGVITGTGNPGTVNTPTQLGRIY